MISYIRYTIDLGQRRDVGVYCVATVKQLQVESDDEARFFSREMITYSLVLSVCEHLGHGQDCQTGSLLWLLPVVMSLHVYGLSSLPLQYLT